jgi:hypothetical protein
MTADATWKVYVQDWIIAYTSDGEDEEGLRECETVLAQRWAGRVEPHDFYIQFAGRRYVIWLRTYQLQGEWRDEAAAVLHQQAFLANSRDSHNGPLDDGLELRLPGLPVVVRSGSPEERRLTEYGQKMLPEPA